MLKLWGQPTYGNKWELSGGKRELYYQSLLLQWLSFGSSLQWEINKEGDFQSGLSGLGNRICMWAYMRVLYRDWQRLLREVLGELSLIRGKGLWGSFCQIFRSEVAVRKCFPDSCWGSHQKEWSMTMRSVPVNKYCLVPFCHKPLCSWHRFVLL